MKLLYFKKFKNLSWGWGLGLGLGGVGIINLYLDFGTVNDFLKFQCGINFIHGITQGVNPNFSRNLNDYQRSNRHFT